GGVFDGAALDLSDFAGHTDDDARANPRAPVVGLADEVLQHLFGHFKVGDNAVFHGTNGDDVAGCAAKHFFGFLANGFDLVGDFVDGDDGRLADHNAASFGIDQRVSRSQVNGEIA